MESNPTFNVKPADRLASVSEYYFSRKLKEIARLNAEGQNIISLAIGSPDMPPSKATVDTLCEQARRDDVHGYQPTMGIESCRSVLCLLAWRYLTIRPGSNFAKKNG